MTAQRTAAPAGGKARGIPSGEAPSRKLARRAADQMIADISTRGWPVGEVLGSEPELLERYGVSRAVFREAVRIVEHLQVARMRRGPGGGLVVGEPTVDAVIGAVLVYLHRVKPDFEEAVEARFVIEDLVIELVTARITEDDMVTLRALAEREAVEQTQGRELHAVLATPSRNPALELFVDILNAVLHLYVPDIRMVPVTNRQAAARAHAAIVEAVVAGDTGLARHRMRVHLEHEADWIRRRRPRRRWPTPMPELADDAKRAEAVSNEMFREILADGWQVGAFVGSEPDLMEQYGVSRAVLRESIRLLEYHQIASMRRGPGGGLFVAEPSVSAVTDAAAVYLERRHTDVAHLSEVRVGLEIALLDFTIKRLDEEGVDALHAALQTERGAPASVFSEVGHDLHGEIAALSDNRILELFARVLVRLTRLHHRTGSGIKMDRRVMDEVQHSHSGIVDAIVAHDAELARHRMRRHLDALAGFLR